VGRFVPLFPLYKWSPLPLLRSIDGLLRSLRGTNRHWGNSPLLDRFPDVVQNADHHEPDDVVRRRFCLFLGRIPQIELLEEGAGVRRILRSPHAGHPDEEPKSTESRGNEIQGWTEHP